MNNQFGLNDSDISTIRAVLAQNANVERALVFGSRAKGNYKTGSDVDIAVVGKLITFKDVSAISYQLNEETSMPYKFDIVNYYTIKEEELIKHIDRVGVEVFHREV